MILLNHLVLELFLSLYTKEEGENIAYANYAGYRRTC